METCEIPVYHMLSCCIHVFYISPLPAVFRTLDGTDNFFSKIVLSEVRKIAGNGDIWDTRISYALMLYTCILHVSITSGLPHFWCDWSFFSAKSVYYTGLKCFKKRFSFACWSLTLTSSQTSSSRYTVFLTLLGDATTVSSRLRSWQTWTVYFMF